MPGFDRTGPRGRGPMTGRGMGFCDPADNYEGVTNYSTYGAVYNRPSYSTYGAYYGRMRYSGRGLGRGRGFGQGYYPW